MIKILFLCHGNICRSPMAEFVMKDLMRRAGRLDVKIESAALHTDEIGNDIHRGTREKLREKGIPFAPRAAWLLTAAKAREYDYLVGMDAYNVVDLRRLVYPEDLPKVCKLLDFAGECRDIADPWYTGNFDATYDDIIKGCSAMLKTISTTPSTAIVSLGSNIEPRARYLADAIAALAALPQTCLEKTSSVIETDPMDVPSEFVGRKFLNQVAVFATSLDVHEFSHRMHQIEDDLGRVRMVRNGPRTIDLDLIDFDGMTLDDPDLTLPHPRAKSRLFVTLPLAELGITL